jgi:uncharacterized protein (TIGR02246 family)
MALSVNLIVFGADISSEVFTDYQTLCYVIGYLFSEPPRFQWEECPMLQTKMQQLFICLLITIVSVTCSMVNGQEKPDAYKELLVLREKIFAAYEARNVNDVLELVHADVVATWQNGFRARGREEVRKFFEDMLTGEKRIVRDVKSKLTVDGVSVLHGDNTAVACGNIADKFELTSGTTLELDSKWTATLVKRDSEWSIASFHVSTNVFENPVLTTARSWMTNLAIIAAVGTGVIGLGIGYFFARRHSPVTAKTDAA